MNSNKVLSNLLENLGLSQNEIKVFIYSYKQGVTKPSKLADLTKIPRTTVYDIVSSLVAKGFMAIQSGEENKSKQLLVKAIDLKEINEIIAKRRKQNFQLEADLATVLSLARINAKSEDLNFIESYQKEDDVYNLIESNEYNNTTNTKYIFENFNSLVNTDEDKASDNKVKGSTKVLFQLTEWSKHILSSRYLKNRDNYFRSEYRYVDSPLFEMNCRIMIVEDYVVITSLSSAEFYGLRLKSKMLSSTLVSLFNSVWQDATTVTEDMFMAWGTNSFLEKELIKKKYWNVGKSS